MKIKNEIWIPMLFTLISVALNSCQKVISVDLNNANPHIVIEGVVTDKPGPYTVSISMTGDYFTPSLYFPPVTGAKIVIQDDKGQRDSLKETAPGTYLSTNLMGIEGRTYFLSVLSNGTTYNASSYMPPKALIDSLYVVIRNGTETGTRFDIYVMFKDPPELGNYYRLNITTSAPIPQDSIDGRRYRLYSDKYTNGNEMLERIRTTSNVHSGDTLTVDLISLDYAAYEYFYTMNDVLISDRSPTSLSPANPNTNLSNGSLGYFAAYAFDTKQIILP